MVANMANSTKATGITVEDKMAEYFTQNTKFFDNGDVNGKKAFFTLGMYTRRIL
jgi:hypothetical protein